MNKLQIWQDWSCVINVVPADLNTILNSSLGHAFKISFRDIEEQGIFSARYSAIALTTMIPTGRSDFASALKSWKNKKYKGFSFWECARQQILNIERDLDKLNGDRPDLNRLTYLKLWGHDLYRVDEWKLRLPAITPAGQIDFYNNPPEVPNHRILLGSKLKK